MELLFPYEQIRDGQSDFIKDILESIKAGKNLIAHAPTGLGKTSSILAACLPYIIKEGLTLFFVTPRHTQHRIAIETLRDIKKKHDVRFSSVDFVGKKHLCCLGGVDALHSSEFAEYCKHMVDNKSCSYYKNTFEKDSPSFLSKALLDELAGQDLLSEEFKQKCHDKGLCGYELALLKGKEARVIVGDYHHVLNPFIRDIILKKINRPLSKCIIIVDEAHNAIDKVKELLSAKLMNYSVERARKEAATFKKDDLVEDLNAFLNIFDGAASEHCDESEEAIISKDYFLNAIKVGMDKEEFLDGLHSLSKEVLEKSKRSYSSTLANFIEAWEATDEHYARIISKEERGIGLACKCLDPSLILRPLADKVHSLIMMSGTLDPVSFHKDVFGFDAETKVYGNPFPKENKLTLIVPDTTTMFKQRTEKMYARIAYRVVEVLESVPGNVFVFFPSYALRDRVYKYFAACSKTIFLESSGMSKNDREVLLNKFKSYKDTGAALLGVTSGSFGEGVDLPGDLLKGVVIVGLPLVRPDLETKELIEYYNDKFGKGNHYGYVLPAFMKTFQNAGRCIRSGEDRGVVVYLDERYVWNNYFSCFPKEERIKITQSPAVEIKKFFSI
jgi:DNA excision repair protein ERCC-2